MLTSKQYSDIFIENIESMVYILKYIACTYANPGIYLQKNNVLNKYIYVRLVKSYLFRKYL